MPSVKVSNPRDLVVYLLGELLFVERRLADQVIGDVARSVHDEDLEALLKRHRDETKEHAERIETAFRRLEAAPTSNLSRPFESAVAQHDTLASSVLEPRLADLFHAQAALHVEHWEMAAYRTLLPLLPDDVGELLRTSFDEEGEAAKQLVRAIDRLAVEPAHGR
jgi:ferritin-like metal-binding protein YciE